MRNDVNYRFRWTSQVEVSLSTRLSFHTAVSLECALVDTGMTFYLKLIFRDHTSCYVVSSDIVAGGHSGENENLSFPLVLPMNDSLYEESVVY